MKLLAVFLLAALGCSLTEARIVTKCELKNQLVKATGNLTVKATLKGPTVDKLLAKIVCHAETVSGFNTSAVKGLVGEVNLHPGNHSGVHKEPLGDVNKHLGNHSGVHKEPLGDVNKHLGNHSGVHKEPLGDVNKHLGNHSGVHKEPLGDVNKHLGNHSGVHKEPLGDVNKHLGNHSGVHKEPLGDVNKHLGNHSGVHKDLTGDHDKRNGKEDHHKNQTGSNQPRSRHRRHTKLPSLQVRPASPRQPPQNCTLYGTFQLSSCQVCSNGSTPSANICGMDCSKLVDDDISDDIGCVLKILLSIGNKFLEKETCENTNPSVYFAGCPST
ncbi:Lysozyme C [Channa argus]|uniref:Lysozyme C n=1 Tax=Channa argus TaxID=215402 RepID=A0A6G1PD01_CHAAH|nr:Lysozyme C [Channa argus]